MAKAYTYGGFLIAFLPIKDRKTAFAAAALGWLAWSRRPRWVAIVILAWVAARLAGSLVSVGLSGRVSWSALGILLLAALYAVAGVRGVWALGAPSPSAQVFD